MFKRMDLNLIRIDPAEALGNHTLRSLWLQKSQTRYCQAPGPEVACEHGAGYVPASVIQN